jgi:hypothetical protein
MKTTETSTRPTVGTDWDDQDDRFFRLVRHVFPAEFLFGAGVLLASNDTE